MDMYHLVFKESAKYNDYFLLGEGKSITYLPNFNKINIIIGANNSGKSRFMRLLLSSKEEILIDIENYNEYVQLIDAIYKASLSIGTSAVNSSELNSNILSIAKSNLEQVSKSRYVALNRYRTSLEQVTEKLQTQYMQKRYYIPTLRTAHSLFQVEKQGVVGNSVTPNIPTEYSKISKDIYSNTLNFNYSIDKNVDIFTGLLLYKNILNTRNSEKTIRDRFSQFENFLSKHFFEGKQLDIVAKFDKDENEKGKNNSELILIHIDGDNTTRKLYELGDGIQAIIILMYKIFMADTDSIIFIDEPELNLHPGMQRLFLEQIYSNEELLAKNLTYVISTHSNHFLDLTLEKDNISIYSFSQKNSEIGKDKQFVIKNVNRGDNSILRDLGVNNSSVFLANSSIWVEGVSDRNYIKAFLKAYIESEKSIKALKEDIDFAFFEYAGSNIEHYIFNDNILEDEKKIILKDINALALSNKIFLLADSDNASGQTAKAERIKRLQNIDKPNFKFQVLQDSREIENLLPNAVWEKVLFEFCNKNVIKGIEDEIQDKIANTLAKVDALDYSNDYIGKFLSEINKRLKHDTKPILNAIYHKNKGLGTLIPKRELSELVLKRVESNELKWEHFKTNPEIERITEAIYKFITT